MVRLSIALLAALLVSACTTTPNFVSYERYGAYASDRAGNRLYMELGPVQVVEHGYLWDDCETLIERAMARLEVEKALLQGDAIVNVRWYEHGHAQPARIPHCTRQWGWFALFGVGGLVPWAHVAQVEGLVVRFERY